MVSMFEYNRRPMESFESFVESFYRDYVDIYLKKQTCECKDIYCHILPMFEYTHLGEDQVVGCVIKQEHLKQLVSSGFKSSNVPVAIQRALAGIPHANRRKRRRPWQQYYNQRTMELVYRMYHKDFKLFGYSTNIQGRPDLSLSEQLRYEVEIESVKETVAADAAAAQQGTSTAQDHVYIEMKGAEEEGEEGEEARVAPAGVSEDQAEECEENDGLSKRFLSDNDKEKPKLTPPVPVIESASSYIPPPASALVLDTEEDLIRRKASVFVLADI
jgi:hypothetical protein